jgi:hypothetical protein
MTSRTEYTTSGASMTLTPGQTFFIDGKRHVVREVFAHTFTTDLDTRNHQTRRVDRAKARAAAKSKRKAS